MLKNYFKTAVRNLLTNKVFSFINIFGLAVGFTCCLLISAFLYSELSYDKFPAHAKELYRVELNVENKDFYSAVDIAVGKGMKNAYAEVEDYTRLINWKNVFVKYEDKRFKEAAVAMVDSNFLHMFSIPFAEGNPATALTQPNSIVISKAMAKKYFGNVEALGKMLLLNNDDKKPYKITGVLDKLPGQLHFNFEAYISLFDDPNRQTWSNVGYYTYLQLKPGTDPQKLQAKFPALVAKYVVPEIQHDMGVSFTEAQRSVSNFIFYLKSVNDIHLYSTNIDELQANGSIRYVYIFSAMAIFILLLAVVNFTNLSTAASVKRSKEVGIRKVLGSEKKQLVTQFLAESILLSFFALLLALLFVYLALPIFNNLSGKEIQFSSFFNYRVIVIELLFTIVVGICAGLYPAFFISSFRIINILKGKTSSNPQGNKQLRSGLVVFQFAVSISLIICTILVYQQLHFMQNKALGFDKEQTIVINDSYLLGTEQAAFKQELLKDSRVLHVSIAKDVPVDDPTTDGTQAYAKNMDPNATRTEIHINKYHIDYDYIKTLGMGMLLGRNFSLDYPTDSASFILNETAVKAFGLKGNPLGQTIVCSGQQEYRVIGVVKDFHYKSIKEKIAPLVMMLGNNNHNMMVKTNTSDMKGLLATIEKKWNDYHVNTAFSYNFLDDRYAAVYQNEERTEKIFSLFAFISIIIASLGLFGLSAYSIAKRTKEIGVRKVLGASIGQLVILLSGEFLIMVLIAFAIAVPFTWFVMHQWLQDFAYRINIGFTSFFIAGTAAVAVAFITVSIQAIKAGVANPVRSLRSE